MIRLCEHLSGEEKVHGRWHKRLTKSMIGKYEPQSIKKEKKKEGILVAYSFMKDHGMPHISKRNED